MENLEPKKDRTIIELAVGILVWGVIIWIAGLLLWEDRAAFSIGLLAGVAVALFMAGHMYYGIKQAADMSEKDAEGYMKRMSLIRTFVVLLVAAGIHFLGLGEAVAVFIGALTLKFGAYSQPLIHKLFVRLGKR